MDPLFFALKRAYLKVVELLWRVAERFRVTPARFDVLEAVVRSGSPPYQAEVARALGVSQVTISRMVRAMEKKHLITRRVDPRDRRKRLIEIGEVGEGTLCDVAESFTDTGAAALMKARAIGDDPAAEHPVRDEALRGHLEVIREQLLDGATFEPDPHRAIHEEPFLEAPGPGPNPEFDALANMITSLFVDRKPIPKWWGPGSAPIPGEESAA